MLSEKMDKRAEQRLQKCIFFKIRQVLVIEENKNCTFGEKNEKY